MSKQIAVRLPEDVVEFVDEQVRSGAGSRAAVVARALERERRRAIAARDAEILARAGADRDMDRLARHAAAVPLDDLEAAVPLGERD
jgi:Arc/MetJ-type ribon-helix-helix transcriptional regulator